VHQKSKKFVTHTYIEFCRRFGHFHHTGCFAIESAVIYRTDVQSTLVGAAARGHVGRKGLLFCTPCLLRFVVRGAAKAESTRVGVVHIGLGSNSRSGGGGCGAGV